jgi:hypothetical protein
MGVGGRGKCPGVPSHHLRKAKGNCNGKSGRPKGTVKSRMAKNGNGNLKKKKKQDIDVPMSCFFLRNFPGCTKKLNIYTKYQEKYYLNWTC